MPPSQKHKRVVSGPRHGRRRFFVPCFRFMLANLASFASFALPRCLFPAMCLPRCCMNRGTARILAEEPIECKIMCFHGKPSREANDLSFHSQGFYGHSPALDDYGTKRAFRRDCTRMQRRGRRFGNARDDVAVVVVAGEIAKTHCNSINNSPVAFCSMSLYP